MSRFDPTERIGVHAVGKIVSKELRWVFRDQPVLDMGIDAHVETCDGDGDPTGRLLGLQIKTGASWFKETTDGGWVYRGSRTHLNYWIRHSLPIVLVLFDDDADQGYWCLVDPSAVQLTEKAWKTTVPADQILDGTVAEAWTSFASAPLDLLRLRRLALAKSLMEAARDNSMVLTASEWAHKTSGRGTVQLLLVDDPDNEEPIFEFAIMAPLRDYAELLPRLLPWASLTIDDAFYEDDEEQEFKSSQGYYDKEEDTWHCDEDDMATWRASLPAIRPHGDEAGEVVGYRLLVALGPIGQAFLTLDAYLSSSDADHPMLVQAGSV